MSDKPRSFRAEKEVEKMIQMSDTAKLQYLAEKVAKIQPFLNENANIAGIKNSAINAVVLARIQHSGLPSAEERSAVFEDCLALAGMISDAQLKRKWEEFRDCVVDRREAEIPEHLIWAAGKAGVDLAESTLKGLIREADERKAGPRLVEH